MIDRRLWLRLPGVLWLGPVVAGRPVWAQIAPQDEPIVQPLSPDPSAFMARAFEMKRSAESAGDQPYGAVVVLSGRIVGQAPSSVVTGGDPGAHAERQAIRDALRRVGLSGIAGSTLYSSSKPCALCEEAAYRAGVSRMIYGADLTDGGSPRAH